MSFTCPVCWRTSYNPNDEAQGYCGYCHDWTGKRNEQMERESDAEAMQRIKVSRVSGDPIALPLTPEYPSKYRFYWGACSLGMGVGISWTLAMTNSGMARYISKTHAITFLYLIVVVVFVFQGWMLHRWSKKLKTHNAEMAKFWEGMNFDPQNPFKGKSR